MLSRAFDAGFKEGFFMLIEKGVEINFRDFSDYNSFFDDSAFIDARPELKQIIKLRIKELIGPSMNSISSINSINNVLINNHTI